MVLAHEIIQQNPHHMIPNVICNQCKNDLVILISPAAKKSQCEVRESKMFFGTLETFSTELQLKGGGACVN
jgi:hypothetical protein